MKPLCILGVIDTPMGHKIKDELINSFLDYYDIECVIHDGTKYEYPALKRAVEKCIESNQNVLYIHTKGASNQIPQPTQCYENKNIIRPKEATLKDWQPTVRKMWKVEFCDNMEKYMAPLNTLEPTVTTPFSGTTLKETWMNGFIMNPAAAKMVYPLKQHANRYRYEHIFEFTSTNVIGILGSNILNTDSFNAMRTKIWTYF